MARQFSEDTAEYVVHKQIDDKLILLKRTHDREFFLGCVFDQEIPGSGKIIELETRGAGSAISNLLNHENIVNLETSIVNYPLGGGQETIILWDWCDAGTLEDMLKNPPVRPRSTGFLPEGLVWHVALGVLRALQWLHEGIRDVYTVRGPESFTGGLYRCHKIRRTTTPEEDWWPVLHRDIRPENIFFQRSKGFETYGAVKLGNFGKAFVSGAIEGPIMAMKETDVPLETIREKRERWHANEDLPRDERPYTSGSEMFDLGTILYQMVTGETCPPADECTHCDGCRHILRRKAGDEDRPLCPHKCVVPDIDIFTVLEPYTDYSDGLRELVTDLLLLHRIEVWGASKIISKHWGGYLWWCGNTEEGYLHKDLFDDVWIREWNRGKKETEDRGGREGDRVGEGEWGKKRGKGKEKEVVVVESDDDEGYEEGGEDEMEGVEVGGGGGGVRFNTRVMVV